MRDLALGGLITLVVGAIAATVTARLEHRRWLRAERLEAWSDVLAYVSGEVLPAYGVLRAAEEDVLTAGDLNVLKERASAQMRDAVHELVEVVRQSGSRIARTQILGPPVVDVAARELLDAVTPPMTFDGKTRESMTPMDPAEVSRLVAVFVDAARHELGAARAKRGHAGTSSTGRPA